jgi:hypothetical protein
VTAYKRSCSHTRQGFLSKTTCGRAVRTRAKRLRSRWRRPHRGRHARGAVAKQAEERVGDGEAEVAVVRIVAGQRICLECEFGRHFKITVLDPPIFVHTRLGRGGASINQGEMYKTARPTSVGERSFPCSLVQRSEA